jgi:hypothetical protein
MDNQKIIDKRIETIGWGLLFIWWGLRWSLLIGLPDGAGLLGTALILFGLNAARALRGVPARGFTTVLAILTLTWGGLEMVNSTARLSIQVPIFETLLVVLGVILVAVALLKTRPDGRQDVH